MYNLEGTLSRCVSSILSQTFQDFELLLIDDGSTDQSGRLCDQWGQRDLRIHVFHKKNGGVSSDRNLGMSQMQGKYLMFVDGDDALKPACFETYLQAMQKDSADIVIGGFTCEDCVSHETTSMLPGREGSYGKELWEQICRDFRMFGYACNKMFCTQIIKDYGLRLRTDMRSQEDLDFCLSYLAYCNRFSLIENTDYIYFYQPGKREPPVWDYISNQLKLQRIAENATVLSGAARTSVEQRIVTLIYSFLYDGEQAGEVPARVQRLRQIEGLQGYLQRIVPKNEPEFVAVLYRQGWDKQLCHYLHIRNKVRDAFRFMKTLKK